MGQVSSLGQVKLPSILSFNMLTLGAGSGIGQAIAIAFVREGCQKITIADMSVSGLEKTKQLIKSYDEKVQVLDMLVDVSDQTAVDDMVKKTVEAFGRLDYGKCLADISSTWYKI